MDQDKENEPQHLAGQPAKKIHHDYDYLCDTQVLQTYPIAKSGPLKNCNMRNSLVSRDCYGVARINDSLFAQPFNAKLGLSSSDHLNRISQIYCGGSIRSVCPLPHTNLGVAIAYSGTENYLIIVDFQNARCKKHKLQLCSSFSRAIATLLKQDLLVLCFETEPSQLIKLKGKIFESLEIEIGQKIDGFPHTRIKPLSSFCYVGNTTLGPQNIISLNDLETFRCQSSVYCISRCSDDLVAIGGNEDKILFYDRRVKKLAWSLQTKQRWVGDINQISQNRVLYSDWNNLVDADIRMGRKTAHKDNKGGIWNISLLNSSSVLTVSSEPIVQQYSIQ